MTTPCCASRAARSTTSSPWNASGPASSPWPPTACSPSSRTGPSTRCWAPTSSMSSTPSARQAPSTPCSPPTSWLRPLFHRTGLLQPVPRPLPQEEHPDKRRPQDRPLHRHLRRNQRRGPDHPPAAQDGRPPRQGHDRRHLRGQGRRARRGLLRARGPLRHPGISRNLPGLPAVPRHAHPLLRARIRLHPGRHPPARWGWPPWPFPRS